jgi:UrcA family protein
MSYSHALACAIAAALIVPAAPPVFAQDSSQDIVVTAPRHGKRSPSGEPTETVSHSTRVKVGDLDLSTPGGQQTLDERIRTAAQASCRWLDVHYPVVDREDDCESAAIADAKRRAKGGAS